MVWGIIEAEGDGLDGGGAVEVGEVTAGVPASVVRGSGGSGGVGVILVGVHGSG